jgi:hypothetical protein
MSTNRQWLERFPIPSEAIEPFAAMLIGRMFARCEAAKEDESAHYHALNCLWYALHGLEKISIAVETATHFSIAMNNHILMVSKYIQAEIGIDPMNHPEWKWK